MDIVIRVSIKHASKSSDFAKNGVLWCQVSNFETDFHYSPEKYFRETGQPALLAHLSRRLTRWAYRIGLEPASVRPSVRPSTLSNMNISETSRPITTKFYLKHHWVGGKAALGFDADQIRTLVSMATDISHRFIMEKRASSRFLDCFWSDPFYTCR